MRDILVRGMLGMTVAFVDRCGMNPQFSLLGMTDKDSS